MSEEQGFGRTLSISSNFFLLHVSLSSDALDVTTLAKISNAAAESAPSARLLDPPLDDTDTTDSAKHKLLKLRSWNKNDSRGDEETILASCRVKISKSIVFCVVSYHFYKQIEHNTIRFYCILIRSHIFVKHKQELREKALEIDQILFSEFQETCNEGKPPSLPIIAPTLNGLDTLHRLLDEYTSELN